MFPFVKDSSFIVKRCGNEVITRVRRFRWPFGGCAGIGIPFRTPYLPLRWGLFFPQIVRSCSGSGPKCWKCAKLVNIEFYMLFEVFRLV